MMTMLPDQGPKLRDIHVPEPGWWPPAPGWWILAVVVLLLLGLLLWWLHRRLRRERFMGRLDTEIRQLKVAFERDQNRALLAMGLSQLLRRTVLFCGGKASLDGIAWQQQLEQLASGVLHDRTLQVLASAPYQRDPHYPVDDLVDTCRQWLRKALVQHAA